MEQEFRAYGTLFSFVCTDGLVSPCEQYALCGSCLLYTSDAADE